MPQTEEPRYKDAWTVVEFLKFAESSRAPRFTTFETYAEAKEFALLLKKAQIGSQIVRLVETIL